MTSLHEAIASVVSKVGGTTFTTQPTKAQPSPFAQLLDKPEVLLSSNDPLLTVSTHLQDSDDLVTVTIDAALLLTGLPLLSQLGKSPAVVHVEISGDYSIVTALTDLLFPVFVSHSVQDAFINSQAAYAAAVGRKSAAVHVYTAVSEKTTLGRVEIVSDFEDVFDILSHYDIEPFTVKNKKGKDAVLLLGDASVSCSDAFVLSVNVYQPFDLRLLLSLIPATVETLTVVEQTAHELSFSPLLLEFFKNYASLQTLKNFTKIVGAKLAPGADLAPVLANTRLEKPVQNALFGEQVQVTESIISSQLVAKARSLEDAYLKVLAQVNADAKIWNNAESANVGTNPEYGFGAFLSFKEQQSALMENVSKAIQSGRLSRLAVTALTHWLVNARQGKLVGQDELKSALAGETLPEAKAISAKLELFSVRSNWLIGSDAWAYDLGSSGVHNVVASGANVNMLVIDLEPHAEKKAGLRKKDIGLYAMNYGGCYVASVAIYSSYTQVLQAFIEAERFDGPSVVLAYLPYESEESDVLSVLKETKSAVTLGYWPLYRYDPTLPEDDRFRLDSSTLRNQLREFLDRENKLSILAARDPQLLRNLTTTANSGVRQAQAKIEDESFKQLLQGLSGPPLTIAFASDGGTAEAVAKKINRQALGRGLKAVVLSMDDVSVEDLATETNIVFVTSTAGQGEFPNNGKGFWDALKQAQDLDLLSVKFSVFGLGDSKYWPRKEDKHYYNKPAVDLFNKLTFYGGAELASLGLGDDQDPDGWSTGFDAWLPQIWTSLGVDGVEGVEEPKPLTNEDMKIGSDFLRGTIAEGLRDESTGAICAVDQQLTKFHGIYMQDDRDIRDERKLQGMEPAYAFMVRLRLPGGYATPSQYLKLDELADERGNGTLKITTRATFQLHGIVKHNLKPAIRGMNLTLLDTLAACGDVNRNVMVSALPENAKIHSQIASVGTLISEHLLPETTAYHEIWLEGADDGDKPGDSDVWAKRTKGPKKKKTMVAGNALVDYEPLYGPTYLPRKFKIVITVPPYNDVDVYGHDVGLIAIVEDNEVVGFNVLAGGGMGSTHNNTKTYPRTGSMMGYVPVHKVHKACENIMLVQRDNGDRTNRKHARLKYTIDDMGVAEFKAEVEKYWGEKFDEPRPFKIDSNIDYFGWVKDELGLNHFTAFVENGRIEDTAELPQKTGLRKIAEYLLENNKSGEFRLTGNQHIVLSNIEDGDLADIKGLLAKYKLDNTDFSGLRLSSSSCVALPTCGLAMAELERYLPELITKLESALEEYGLRHDSVVMRMTGCPNGCARPWLAEVALVGKAMGAYNLMLGGGHHGQRLNKIYRYSIKESEILGILKPLFKRWSLERQEGEPFGDFCIRVGVIKETTEGKYFHDDIPEDA